VLDHARTVRHSNNAPTARRRITKDTEPDNALVERNKLLLKPVGLAPRRDRRTAAPRIMQFTAGKVNPAPGCEQQVAKHSWSNDGDGGVEALFNVGLEGGNLVPALVFCTTVS
jgi:hypothetical protein